VKPRGWSITRSDAAIAMNAAPNGREIFLSRLFFRFTAFVEKKISKKIVARKKTISYLDRVSAHGIALARL